MNLGSKRQKELIEKLYQLIEYELNKPEAETDSDLIAECAEYLEELQAGEIEFSDEEILSRLEAIKAQVAAETSLPTSEPEKKSHEKKRPQFRMIFIPIAATFLALVLAVTIVGCENWTTLGKFLTMNLKRIASLSKGDEIEDDEISLIKASERTVYQTLEDFFNQENPDILFPQPLPDGSSIKKIYHYQTNENQSFIVFYFNNQDLMIKIKNYYQMDYNRKSYIDEYDYNSIHYYAYFVEDTYFISCQYNGYEYYFESSDLNLLKQLINNMKELKT